MRPQLKLASKLAATLLLAGVALVWLISRTAGQSHGGEQVWFHDQSEKRLYPGNADTIPPDKGIGGKSGDGVRAIVVAFPADQNDPRKRRIAYLETYAPQLKDLLERILKARAARRPFGEQIPSRDSDFFQTNTLVKHPNDTDWQPVSSAEGQQIMSQWRSWRSPDGRPPIVCAP